jgi:dTDP-4-amino-4,6-dideoxygalactose transaminase
MCKQVRGDTDTYYEHTPGKTCPDEILETLAMYNVQGRPIWKPMHMQPIYAGCGFVTRDGQDVGADVFQRGLCLPSDIKMTAQEQDKIIQIIRSCFA